MTQKLVKSNITNHNEVKYISIQEFNKLTSQNFAVRFAQANLASKNDIPAFVKKYIF